MRTGLLKENMSIGISPSHSITFKTFIRVLGARVKGLRDKKRSKRSGEVPLFLAWRVYFGKLGVFKVLKSVKVVAWPTERKPM